MMDELAPPQPVVRTASPARQWPLLLLLVAGVAYAAFRSPPASTSDWPADFEEARQAAAASGRPLLIQFSSAQCPYCVKMEQGVLPAQQVATSLKQFELVRVDAWARSDLSSQYRIEGVPAFVVVGPQGRLIAKIEGYQPLETFVDFLSRAAAAATMLPITTTP